MDVQGVRATSLPDSPVQGIDPIGNIRNLHLVNPDVDAPGGCNVGSLAGYFSQGTVLNCRATGGSVRGADNVGGLVGKGGPEISRASGDSRAYPKMQNSGFVGVVSGRRSVGGLVGLNESTSIARCRASGSVAGDEKVGGLVGVHQNNSLEHCYSTAHVIADRCVGGLVGECVIGITNCYAAGSVTGNENAGGLIGYGHYDVIGSFWDVDVSGQLTSIGGQGKATPEMKSGSTFFFWNACDGEPVWTIAEGKDYPRLWWEDSSGRIIRPVLLSDRLQGTGTENDPFLIFTAEELNTIALYPCESDKHFKLMADLDLSIYTGNQFNIIRHFRGVFDGNHHTLANFTYHAPGHRHVGLFSYVWGPNGQIKDLGLVHPRIDAGTGYSVGSLAAYSWHATISNCFVEGGTISGGSYTGGLVGDNYGVVSHCRSTAAVTGTQRCGGLVGYNNDTIFASCAEGITAGQWDVGGLVGANRGKIESCYAAGEVTGRSQLGGLLGDHEAGRVVNCYATGPVVGDASVGGFVGACRGTVMNCYASGRTVGDKNVGGLAGLVSDSGAVFGSFWDIQTSVQPTSAGGTGKTTAELRTAETFAGWGVDGAWTLDEGRDYPRLAWENRPGLPITMPVFASVEGLGSPEAPFLIRTSEQFSRIGRFPSIWDSHFVLMADIDLSANQELTFVPIGAKDLPFRGVFDGNGHTISHFRCSRLEGDCIGLFGYVDDPNAEIRGLGLIDADIEVTEGGWHVGSLAGHLETGTVIDCYATGSVSGDAYVGGLVGTSSGNAVVNGCHTTVAVRASRYLGGLIGSNDGMVVNCHAAGNVEGTDVGGGLMGSNDGVTKGCYATGDVSGGDNAGGLIGWNCWNGVVLDSHATGDVQGEIWAGGLIGDNSGGIVEDCHATGDVDGRDRVGGLAGSSDGIIAGCCSRGSVTGQLFVGGLLGVNLGSLQDSYAIGKAEGRECVGGLIGINAGDARTCFAAGRVSGSVDVGGLVGYREEGTCRACFWDVETTRQSTSAAGTGKTTAEMRKERTFLDAGWDFLHVWCILEGRDYPKLVWEF